MADIFKKDDAGFISWRDSNPGGYICNMPYPAAGNERDYYAGHICLHKVGCCTISPNRNGEKPWTSTDYFKICASEVREIEAWIHQNADLSESWKIRRCSRCTP